MDSGNHAGPSRSSTSSRPSLDLPLGSISLHPLLSEPSFDPDSLLQSRSHIPLEELRGDLRSHLGVLREELVQLINEDYEEFIALGVGLRGEVQRLTRLELPLRELMSEVEAVVGLLEIDELRLQSSLLRRSALREESNLLEAMHKLYDVMDRVETLDGVDARIGNEYSQINYLLQRLDGCLVVDALGARLDDIRTRIEKQLASELVVAFKSRSTLRLEEILKIYDVVEGWDEARAAMIKLMQTLCEEVLTPSSLTAEQAPSTPLMSTNSARIAGESPLAGMYNRMLNELEDTCFIFDIAEGVSRRFAFVETVLFPCLCSAIKNLGIFSAGRPTELHENYITTTKFLAAVERFAPSVISLTNIRESTEIAALQRQWQLPVYFQLRWKDIITKLERAIEQPAPSNEWLIPQTAAFYEAVRTCWGDDVYIQEYAGNFWKLTLQILARYRLWLRDLPKDDELHTAIRSFIDLERLRVKAQSLLRAYGVQDLISDALACEEYSGIICNLISGQCAEQLKPIRAVASQLRTSKSTGSSAYIPLVFRPLRLILGEYPGLDTELARQVVAEVFLQAASMLASVRKTEDLLRRHRKSRKTGFSLFASSADEGGEEEEKRFDQQMTVDIVALGREAGLFGVGVEDLVEWRELNQVMERPVDV